jgi:hypothetical protein
LRSCSRHPRRAPIPDDPDASLDADSILTIVAGACPDIGTAQLACNDDIVDGTNVNSRVDVPLEEGETVTIYAGEFREPGGGTISVLDD